MANWAAYGSFAAKLANKEIDWDSDTLKVMLCTSAYAPNNDTHDYKNDVTNEVTGTGYTAGGATVTGTISQDTTNNRVRFIITDPSWAAATITARYAVLYDSTPATDATRPLIAYLDFVTDVTSTAGTFLVDCDGVEGILRFGY